MLECIMQAELRSDSQPCCFRLAVTDNSKLWGFLCVCVLMQHPRHLSITAVVSEADSLRDEGLFDLITEGEHTARIIMTHTRGEGKVAFLVIQQIVPSVRAPRQHVWRCTHTHTHTPVQDTREFHHMFHHSGVFQ